MISEIFYLVVFLAGIALVVRLGLFPRLLSVFWRQRIHDELHERLKISAPHLQSTFDGVSSDSGSSTSR